jgi:tetratricopeptide (TPR) repeat protein
VNWDEHAERAELRYADALARLPEGSDLRQKQLVRAAMTAGAAGLVRLMQGRDAEAKGWFVRSAERYRESWPEAPPGSWGRLIGALKARMLAGDWAGAETDARWALEQRPADSGTPIGRYAAALAELALGDDAAASPVAATLLAASPEEFPPAVAEALAALAKSEAARYAGACAAVLESFDTREAFLEDIPVADTVIVLEALAERRGIALRPRSPLLPPGAA